VAKPVIYKNEMYELIRSEQIAEFNKRKDAGEPTAGLLCGGDFRGLDLRELDVDGLDLNGGYFRSADMRGLDLRNTNLEGASFCQAHISGCYFPPEVTADEIRLSLEQGTRIRYRRN
jgi:uncharacterized protein YjbI with pentapeptide repeats